MEENQLPSTLARPAKLIFLQMLQKNAKNTWKEIPKILTLWLLHSLEQKVFWSLQWFPPINVFFHKYQAEDDLQEEIEELEIKLMRSNAVKEELDGIHLKMEKMWFYTINVHYGCYFFIIIIF